MRAQRYLLAAGAAALAFGAAGCQVKDDGDDLVNGKTAFVEKCGACHVLERAGTTGVAGPDLDAAFERSLSEGFGRNTIEGVVLQQIKAPNTTAQVDPVTNKRGASMPADIVTGETAEDVAAYVAFAAARGGEDPGRLADIGVNKAEGIARAENGTLTIPADPGGALAYEFASAEAQAGEITLVSKNDSAIPHNIAVEGNGIDEQGPVVQGGGTSEVTVELQPGEYTFYCSVPGHREGGMAGPLTVK